jgi:DNA-binding NarL/FixJ family response regulator
MTGSPVRVVISYRAPLFVLGLQSLLAERNEVEVVGATWESHEIVATAAETEAEVVLVEPLTPTQGAVFTRELLALDPPPRVVVVDDRDGRKNALKAARRAGAHGSVTCDASVDELVAELLRVAECEARTAA